MNGVLYYTLLVGGPSLILATSAFTVAQFVGLVKLFNGVDKYIMIYMRSLQVQLYDNPKTHGLSGLTPT